MPITATQTNNINQINVAMGGGIISEAARVTPRGNPMLVIGLGGTGIDAALRVKHLVNKRFTLPDDGRGGKRDSPDNIRFLGFETSVDDIKNKEFNGARFDYTTEYVDISYPDLDIAMRNQDLYLTGDIRRWIHPDLASKISGGTAGANGVRQGGRLMMHLKIDEIVSTLDSLIRKMFEGKGDNSRLEVFILSGISGGTGSGTFLDVPYIIRGLMDANIVSRGPARLDVMGYIFLPDVLISKPGLDPEYRDTIVLNGYAAIKELDYLMNTSEPEKNFRERYGTRLTVDTSSPPFDLCHLVSSTATGGSTPAGAYSYAMGVAAEHIVNFMTQMEIKAGEAFDIHAYISNLKTVSTAIRKRFPANYQYCILGASSLELPQEDLLTYLAAKMFLRLRPLREARPGFEDRSRIAKETGLDIDNMEMDFASLAPAPFEGVEGRAAYKPAQLARDRASADEDFAYWKKEARAAVRERADSMAESVAKKLFAKAEELFCDPSFGPYYVQRLLYSSGGNDLLSLITEFKRESKARMASAASELRIGQRAVEEAHLALGRALVKTAGKRAEFLAAYRSYAEEWLKEEIYARMDEVYTDIYNRANSLYSRVYGTFADLFSLVAKTFERDADILSSAGEAAAYTRKMVSVAEKEVQSSLDRRVEEEDMERFARTLFRRALDEMPSWVDDSRVDITGFIGRLATEVFNDVATQTMDLFLAGQFHSASQAQAVLEADFIPRLASSSMPMFFMSAAGGQLNLPTWSMVSVPKTGTIVKSAIAALQSKSAFSSVQIAETDIESRIFWLNMKVGVPFYANDALEGYEETYMAARRSERFIGVHLYQNEAYADWSSLPSPISETVWSEGFRAKSRLAAQENQEAREAFSDALRLGVAKLERDSCVFYPRPDVTFSKLEGMRPAAAEEAAFAQEAMADLLAHWQEGALPQRIPSLYQAPEGSEEKMYFESLCFFPKLSRAVRENAEKARLAKEIGEFSRALLHRGEREAAEADEFAIACATRAVFRSANSFAFYDRAQEREKPIVHVPSLTDPAEQAYVEYALYRRFASLGDRERSDIRVAAQEAVSSDDASIPAALGSAERLIQSRLEQLDQTLKSGARAESLEHVRSFYLRYRDSVKRRLNTYNFGSL
jgi:hypothetical protein